MSPKSTLSEAELTELERFRLFVESVSDYAIYMLSPEGYVKSWNAGAQRFKGYTEEEILGQHFSSFYPPEDQEAGKPARALKLATENGRYEDEGWRVRKDGTRFWANVVIDPVHDASGDLIGFTKVTRDITQNKQASEDLHASEQQFRLLVQGVTDYAIYMLSPQGMITNWNAGAERSKGYSEKEVLGTHFSRFYTPEERTRNLPAHALATAEQEGRYENEGWRVRKDGSQFWAHIVIDALHNDLGKLIGFAKITRDVTERRETALKLEQAREALFQSQKLEALGKLTGGIAHDFNNLLSVISTGLEIITMQPHNPALDNVLESMKGATVRGARLNQQLLTFARKQPMQMAEVQINDLINSFEAVLRRACDSTIRFDIDLALDLYTVLVDEVQFEAALLNLVTNARDAMPNGGHLRITTEYINLEEGEINKLPQGRYVRVSVCDTGMGMTEDTASQAIEPFFTTKPLGEGTGLGLSQVYGLMQQSQGDIVIESVAGDGTTIALILPALSIHDKKKKSSKGEQRGICALLVDDQPDVLSVTVQLFKALDYEVLSANSGKDALEIMRRHPKLDLLFTDVMMPGMSGVELASEARRINPGIQVLLTSGYAGETLTAKGHDPDRYKLIRKPYSLKELLQSLGNLVPAG